MPMTCTLCRHEKREEIDKALIEQRPLRSIAEQYGTSATALLRHKSEHLPKALVESRKAHEAANADSLMAQMRDLNHRTLAILKKAEKAGQQEVALKAIGEVRRNHELLGKLMGELGRAKPSPPKHDHKHLHLHGNDAIRAFVLATGRLPSSEEMARLNPQVDQKAGIENHPQGAGTGDGPPENPLEALVPAKGRPN